MSKIETSTVAAQHCAHLSNASRQAAEPGDTLPAAGSNRAANASAGGQTRERIRWMESHPFPFPDVPDHDKRAWADATPALAPPLTGAASLPPAYYIAQLDALGKRQDSGVVAGALAYAENLHRQIAEGMHTVLQAPAVELTFGHDERERLSRDANEAENLFRQVSVSVRAQDVKSMTAILLPQADALISGLAGKNPAGPVSGDGRSDCQVSVAALAKAQASSTLANTGGPEIGMKVDSLSRVLQALFRLLLQLSAQEREETAIESSMSYAHTKSRADSMVTEARSRLYGAIASAAATGAVTAVGLKTSLSAQRYMRNTVLKGTQELNVLKKARRGVEADLKKAKLPALSQTESARQAGVPAIKPQERLSPVVEARLQKIDAGIESKEIQIMQGRSQVDADQARGQSITTIAYSMGPIASAGAEISAAMDRGTQAYAEAASQMAQTRLQDRSTAASKALDLSSQIIQTMRSIRDSQIAVAEAAARSL